MRPTTTSPWQDPRLPIADRVADLMSRMTVAEKVGQLAAYWAAPNSANGPVAPMQDEFDDHPPRLEEIAGRGLGGLTRVYGTAPVPPEQGRVRLRALQRQVVSAGRFGIPAIVHEECLTGFMARTATIFPGPLAWGASFHPELVGQMGAAIGETMRRAEVHQGLAPVLDVARDPRWGRTEETIGEDPYLVARIGTAYVREVERSGVVATLKHFAGHSASRAARNMAPATIGPREFADVILEPFVAAIREGGARSVMHSYSDVDGMPPAGDERLLTDLLRERLGFTGLVVADYFGITFLETQHGVADSPAQAAAVALRAGVDMELPQVRCYGDPLLEAAERGVVPAEHLDRAVSRVLHLKCELGLLDPPAPEIGGAPLEFDPPAHRSIARRLAEESIVLLANGGGLLPLRGGRIAVAGPLADDPLGMMGCYSFPQHVGYGHPEMPLGVEIPTVADALREELPETQIKLADGGDLLATGDGPIDAAVAAARDAEACVLVLGDRPGMFGRGTSGEGSDVSALTLPGRQEELASAVLDTGIPTVIVIVSGRPYALGALAGRAGALVQAFLPGQEGGRAVAGVLSGRVAPSGRLPISIPRGPEDQPVTYLRTRLDGPSSATPLDSTPLFPFGHGLTWTRFVYTDLTVDPVIGTDGIARVSATVRNAGQATGTEVVQLYLSDPVASVVRPVRWLAGFTRVELPPGAAARVEFAVHADRTSFTGPDLARIVEPGEIGVAVGGSSSDLPLRGTFRLDGMVRRLGRDRVLAVPVTVSHE